MNPSINTTVAGVEFATPICGAGGMDKDGTRLSHFDSLGFGAIEVGSITLRERMPGRVSFNLLLSERAIINSMGAPSMGAARTRLNIRNHKKQLNSKLGINLIPNLDADEYDTVFSDTFRMIHLFRGAADFYVVNVSSPNMKDLRELQNYRSFSGGLKLIKRRMTSAGIQQPVFVKFACDMTQQQTVDAVRGFNEGLYAGVIIGNSSVWRPDRIQFKYKTTPGGLSGSPIAELSNNAISSAYRLSEGQMPIIGCGGILSAHAAYEKILSGASLVQLHSAMHILPIASQAKAFKFVADLNLQLSKYLLRDGFRSVSEAVGTATQALGEKT